MSGVGIIYLATILWPLMVIVVAVLEVLEGNGLLNFDRVLDWQLVLLFVEPVPVPAVIQGGLPAFFPGPPPPPPFPGTPPASPAAVGAGAGGNSFDPPNSNATVSAPNAGNPTDPPPTYRQATVSGLTPEVLTDVRRGLRRVRVHEDEGREDESDVFSDEFSAPGATALGPRTPQPSPDSTLREERHLRSLLDGVREFDEDL